MADNISLEKFYNLSMEIDFRQFKTPEELYDATGLTVREAIKIVDKELEEIRRK